MFVNHTIETHIYNRSVEWNRPVSKTKRSQRYFISNETLGQIFFDRCTENYYTTLRADVEVSDDVAEVVVTNRDPRNGIVRKYYHTIRSGNRSANFKKELTDELTKFIKNEYSKRNEDIVDYYTPERVEERKQAELVVTEMSQEDRISKINKL